MAWLVTGAIAALACGANQPQEQLIAQRADALEVAAPIIGTDPPAAIQYNTGGYLSVATDGDNSMVVFYDGGEIRGMRYAADGTLLDLDEWVRLGRNDDETGAHAYTDVAYGNGVYMALFSDSTEGQRGIYVQAVDVDGELLSVPVRVGPDAYYGSVVFNGTDFTVAWSNGDVGLARVGLDAEIVTGTETYVTTSGGTNRPVLAMGSETGLVAYEAEVDGTRLVYAARFDADANVLDPEGTAISSATTSSVSVSAAAGNDEFVVAWTASSDAAVYGTVVGFDGGITSLEFPISRSPGTVGGSTVGFDGTNYLVAWQDSRDSGIYGTRLSSDGTNLDTSDVPIAAPSRVSQSWDIDVVYGDGRYSLAFLGEGVEGRFIDDSLSELDPGALQLSALPSAQNIPSSAYNGQSYVLGWSDERDQRAYQFRAGRIDDAGNRLDPDGISVSPLGEQVGNVSVAAAGDTTFFSWQVWGDEPTLYKRTLDGDGNLSEALAWHVGQSGGTVRSNGDSFLALYSAGDNGVGNDNEIWGQWFDTAGNLSGDPALLVTISRPRYGLWTWGNEYLLAYSGQEADGTPITGSVLTLDGGGQVTAEYEPVVEGMLTASAGASDTHILFTWQDDSDVLWGRILTKGGSFGEPFVVSDQITADTAAIAWNGSTFVTVWPEERTAMWTRNVSPDGGLSEPEQIFTGDYGWVRLTPGPEGQMLLSYVRWLEWSRSRRIESRIVGTLGEGVIVDPVNSGTSTLDPAETPAVPVQDVDSDPMGEDPEEASADPTPAEPPSAADERTSEPEAEPLDPRSEPMADPGSDVETAPADMGEASDPNNDGASSSGGGSDGCSVGAAGDHSKSPTWFLLLLALLALCKRRDGQSLDACSPAT